MARLLLLLLLMLACSAATIVAVDHIATLSPAQGVSSCVNTANDQRFTLTTALVQSEGAPPGVQKPVHDVGSRDNCFVLEMTANSGHFHAGDLWEICVDPILAESSPSTGAPLDEVPPVPSSSTLNSEQSHSNKPLVTGAHAAVSSLLKTPAPHIDLLPPASLLSVKRTPAETAALAATDPVSTTTIRVDSTMPDTPANASACDSGLQDRATDSAANAGSCNLRSAVAYCDTLLTMPRVECIISLPPMEDVYMSPHFGEILLQQNAGVLRIEGNGCRITSLPSSVNATGRLFNILDPSERREFSFSLSNATISGFGNVMLDGGALNFFSIAAVSISSVSFSGNVGLAGGALCFDKCHNVELAYSQFLNNTASSDGGGIYMYSDNIGVNITSCDFITNTVVGDQLSPIGTGTFRGGGMAVYFENHNFLVTSCNFFNNTSIRAGALIFMIQNTNITISESSFVSNTGTSTVGGLDFTHTNSDIVIINCDFIGNYGLYNTGGLRFYDGNINFEIVDCIFRENKAHNHGAGISAFYDNYNFKIKGTIIESNTILIGGEGAGVSIGNTNANIDIINCTLRLNVNNAGVGGAISINFENSHVNILDCQFIENVVLTGGDGGGIFIDKANTEIVLRNNAFLKNKVAFGIGGGLFFHSENIDVICDRLMFVGNHAGGSGGAIALLTANFDATIQNCSFVNNSAAGSGGALYSALSNSGITVVDSVFTSNTASVYGGAIYFGEQHERTMAVLNTTVTYNRADRAGGIFIFWFNELILLDGCTISSNFAESIGGAVLSVSQSVTILKSAIEGNVANHDYGGILIEDAQKVLIKNTNIVNNSAIGNLEVVYTDEHTEGNGGLAILHSMNVEIDYCFFEANYAYLYGGAFYATYSEYVAVRNTIMRANDARLGGAVNLYRITHAIFFSVRFEDNSAVRDGGAMHMVESKDVLVSNCSFLGNSANRGFGSAAWLHLSSAANFTGNYFDGNRAPLGAGTVFWDYLDGSRMEPAGVRDKTNIFTDSNYAAYGTTWATDAMKIVAQSDGSQNGTNNVIEVTEYEEHIPMIALTLLDYYDQVVVTESQGYGQLLVPNDSPQNCQTDLFYGYIGGGIVEQFRRGVAIFQEVDAFCAPEGVMYLEGVSDLVLNSTVIELNFRPCVVGEYFVERICSPCDNGTYSFTDPAQVNLTDLSSDVCKPCPTGAEHCFKDQIVVKNGHWRINDIAESILQCPWDEESCLGSTNTGDDSCGSLYTGPLCAVCVADHFHVAASDTCRSCQDIATWFDAFTVSVLVLLMLGLVAAGYVLDRTMREQRLQNLNELFIYVVLKLKLVDLEVYLAAPLAVNENILICNRRVRTLFKMYLTFFQVVSSIPTVLNYDEFPPGFKRRMIELSSVVNMGISRSAVFSCFFDSSFDFIDRLLMDTIYPAVVLVLFILVYQIHVRVKFGRGRVRGSGVEAAGERDTNAATHQAKRATLRAKYMEFFLFFTYLILPSLVVTIFETFSCHPIDPDDVDDGDNYYLRADYSISCHSSRYRFAEVWAILMIFVYVLGVPAFYFYVLHTNKRAIMLRDLSTVLVDDRGKTRTQQQLSAIRILFDSYKPRFWYWELVETAFRLSLTGFLVLGAYAGDNAQMLLGLCLAVLFTKLYEFYEPFLDNVSQSSKVISLWEICVVFFLFILMKDDFISETTITVLASLLVVTIFVNFGVGVVRVLRQFIADTAASNKEGLGQRERSITTALATSSSSRAEEEGEEDRQRVTSVVFSPLDLDRGVLARKELHL